MRAALHFDGCTEPELRAILAACSRDREAFPFEAQPWQPRVQCEGPRYYGVTVSPCDGDVAARILSAAREAHDVQQS